MKQTAWVLLLGLVSAPVTACKKAPAPTTEATRKPAVQRPAKPTNGAPVALVFAAMAYKGDRWGADLRVFSFSKHDVRTVNLTFHFLDKKGVELARLPYVKQGSPLMQPGAKITLEIKARMPRATDRVTVTLDRVLFMYGGAWKRAGAATSGSG